MSELQSANWSETAASNNAAAPDGWPEGMLGSAVNNAARELMAAIKRDWNRSHVTISSTGSANAYVLTYANAPTLTHGMIFSFKANFANTGTATANVNSLGAKTIVLIDGATALPSGAIVANQHVHLEYDSALDKLVMLNPLGSYVATYPVMAGSMTPRTTNGASVGVTESTTNKNMMRTLDFDTSTQEFAQFEVFMPKGWDEGTFTFQPIWTAASGSGGVVWALQAVATGDDDGMDVAFGTEQTSTDTLLAAIDRHIGPTSAAITAAGTPVEGDVVQFQIKRNVADASDTLAVDAKLLGIRLFYNVNNLSDG